MYFNFKPFYIFQYAVGFFSFLLLLICNKGTANFRASLVPIHAAFGILTFILGASACLTGLTEKALFTLGYVCLNELYFKKIKRPLNYFFIIDTKLKIVIKFNIFNKIHNLSQIL